MITFQQIWNEIKPRLNTQSAKAKLEYLVDWIMLIFTIVCIIVAIVVGLLFYMEPHDGKTPSEVLRSSGLSEWDWIAIALALVSLFYAAMTFYSQRQTERNTMKITPESQRELLVEYTRHFYANLIVICAVEAKLDKRFDRYYPAEEHLLKLKVDLNTLHTAVFFNHIKNYQTLNELQVKLRNFNEEIDVMVRHLTQQYLSAEAKQRDFNTLKFKMSYLTGEVVKTINNLWPGNDDIHAKKIRECVTKCGDKRNTNPEGLKLLRAAKIYFGEKDSSADINEYEDAGLYEGDGLNPRYYYKTVNSELINSLFPVGEKDSERDDSRKKAILKFIRRLNLNIYAEIYGKNSSGGDKIFLIPFSLAPTA